jgi:hypothetical protein
MSEQADIPEFYTDAFTIAWSPFGVDLTFGRDLNPETGLRQPRATIVMSPQLAELLAAELGRVIDISRSDNLVAEHES